MKIINYTPFPPLFFESRSLEDRPFGVFIIKGTFKIDANQRIKPIPEQNPIVLADEYFGDARTSSVKLANDIAPLKPRSEIHINAVARSLHKKPKKSWLVDVQIGKLKKSLRVTGPRFWKKKLGMRVLTDPEDCTEVPIRYEHAFGGTVDDDAYQYNPVGAGWLGSKTSNISDSLPAPQIESPEEPIESPAKTYKPEGLGPIAPAWLPRREFGGTFDQKWKEERAPQLPLDFNFSFYNAAHPDLIYPEYLQGNEKIQLQGFLHDLPTYEFQLPCYQMAILARYQNGAIIPSVFRLDTLYIDCSSQDIEQHRVHLTWRGHVSLAGPIRLLEARMLQSSN